MSLFHKHPLFWLQEVPDVPCFGIPALSCLLLFHFFVFHLAFFFNRNECRTTLVFPSCQINNLSEYIERKQYSLKCVKLYVLPFAAFIRWLSTYLAAWDKDCSFFFLTRSASHLKCSAACGSRKMEACASRLALSSFFLSA